MHLSSDGDVRVLAYDGHFTKSSSLATYYKFHSKIITH
jgi:hypothetical protein